MEGAECEVHTVYGNESVASLSVTTDSHVIKGEMLKLLHGPVRQHQPRDDRVDEEEKSVGYPSGHAA